MEKNNQNSEPVYGCITEQGDLGLGFNVLNETDQKAARDQQKNEK